MGDFSVFDYTRLKACQLADLAPTSNPSGRRKKSGVSIRSTSLILSADAVSIFDVSFRMSFLHASFHLFGVCGDINFEMYNSVAYTTATNENNQETTTRFYP